MSEGSGERQSYSFVDGDIMFELHEAVSKAANAHEVQDGTEWNANEMQLTDKVREVLSWHLHEFTFRNMEIVGWTKRNCRAEDESEIEIDLLMRSGAVLDEVARIGFCSIGIDLNAPKDFRLPFNAKTQVQ